MSSLMKAISKLFLFDNTESLDLFKKIFPENEQFSWGIFFKKLFGLEQKSTEEVRKFSSQLIDKRHEILESMY